MAILTSKIKLVNVLIGTENVMCVYRNYIMLEKRGRSLAVIRIIGASLTYLASLVHYNIFAYERFFQGDFMLFIYIFLYNILTTILAIANIILGLRQSMAFQIIISNIDSVHECCSNLKPRVYSQELHKLAVKTFIVMVFLLTTLALMFTNILLSAHSMYYIFNAGNYALLSFHTILMMWKEAQFYSEILLFNVLIGIITIALKQMNATLRKSTRLINETYNDLGNINGECKILRDAIRKLIPIFNCLKICTSKLKLCFGIQVSISVNIIYT